MLYFSLFSVTFLCGHTHAHKIDQQFKKSAKVSVNNATAISNAQSNEKGSDNEKCDKRSNIENEFVSDTFRTTDKDLEEVKAGMKILGIDTLAQQHVSTTIDTSSSGAGKKFFFLFLYVYLLLI